MKKILRSLLVLWAAPLCIFSSCTSYTMTGEQLYSQIHNATPKEVSADHPMQFSGVSGALLFGPRTYLANGVKEIECQDKKGKKIIIPNSPRVEMRITDKKNHKHIFYFDSIILEDSVFSGLNSRILNTRKSVNLADIKKVELQKGAKKYNYVQD